MIKVSKKVFEGLEAVRYSAITNMFDTNAVIHYARLLGYKETVKWVSENKQEYSQGLLSGFEAGS